MMWNPWIMPFKISYHKTSSHLRFQSWIACRRPWIFACSQRNKTISQYRNQNCNVFNWCNEEFYTYKAGVGILGHTVLWIGFQFQLQKTGGCVGRPELCVDLNGALIDRGDKMSSRRHVYLISTVLTLQVLIQFESSSHADSWLLAIHNAIKNLVCILYILYILTLLVVTWSKLSVFFNSKKYWNLTRLIDF